jgi:hypothetical protein
MYQTNHPDGTAHGVTAILIKQTINHYELPKYETQHIQATSVKVKALPYETTESAVYCPPRHNLKSEYFESFFETLGSTFIAGEDYNCKHTMWVVSPGNYESKGTPKNNYKQTLHVLINRFSNVLAERCTQNTRCSGLLYNIWYIHSIYRDNTEL